tara:strand:+ start:294 stop:548 length:255 start_codon:yes stop_codon:yes gene_type:complete
MTTIRSAKDVQFKDAIIDMKLSYKGASYDEAKGKFIDKIKQVTVSKIDKTKTGRITLWVVQDGALHSCKLFQNGPANPERFIFI